MHCKYANNNKNNNKNTENNKNNNKEEGSFLIIEEGFGPVSQVLAHSVLLALQTRHQHHRDGPTQHLPVEDFFGYGDLNVVPAVLLVLVHRQWQWRQS